MYVDYIEIDFMLLLVSAALCLFNEINIGSS